MLMLRPMPFNSLYLESGGEGGMYFCHSPSTHTPERLGIFAGNLNHANETSLETFWHTQVQNLKYLSLTSVSFF